jgi:hypothetical protein
MTSSGESGGGRAGRSPDELQNVAQSADAAVGETAESTDSDEDIPDDIKNQIFQRLRKHNVPDQDVNVILAELRQLFLSVEHHYPRSDLECLADAADHMEMVAAGRGQQFLDTFIEDYRAQIFMRKSEQNIQKTFLGWGMACGVLIGLCLIAGAVYCATIDQPVVAAALVGAAALNTVASFLDVANKRHRR